MQSSCRGPALTLKESLRRRNQPRQRCSYYIRRVCKPVIIVNCSPPHLLAYKGLAAKMCENEMNPALNETLMRRLGLIYLPRARVDDRTSQQTFLSTIQTLQGLGYRLDSDAMEALLLAPNATTEGLVEHAKHIRGVADYKPMYVNFPASVEMRTDLELYANAIFHYLGDWCGVRIMPVETWLPRPPLDVKQAQTLSLASVDRVRDLATSLVTQGEPFSESDRDDLRRLHGFVGPSPVPIRENLVFVAIQFPDMNFDEQFDRATDILRYAAGLSGGDPSLCGPVKFRLPRANRRRLASVLCRILGASSSFSEDVASHAELWKRLCKTVHFRELSPGPKEQGFLDSVYHETNRSLASKIQEPLRLNDLNTVLELNRTRPGIFARGLAELLRKFPNERGPVLQAFTEVAPRVSQRVLIQMWNLFQLPDKTKLQERSFTGRSRSGNREFLPNRLEGDQKDVRDAIRAGLKGRNAHLKVNVDMDEAACYTVPLGNRSAAPGMRVIGRGSRVKLSPKSKALRFFMHWRNIRRNTPTHRCVDLDLSGYFVSEGFEKAQYISFLNLRDATIRTFHSGDITSAPHGAAEFIDIDVEAALKGGLRYVAMAVNSYSRQPFSEIPDAWAGIMERSDVNCGEIFEPSTVTMRYDVTSDSRMSLPLLVDLVKREMIWVDMSLSEGTVLTRCLKPIRIIMAESLSGRMTVAELLTLTGATIVEAEEPECMCIDPKDASQVLGLINT